MKFPKLLLIFAVVVLLTLGVAAQTKKLSVKEFDSEIDAAIDATAKKVRRITETFTDFEPGKEVESGINTYEYIPPNRFRSYGGLSGSQEKSWEYIEANNNCYIKDKNGIWKYFYIAPDIPPQLFWHVNKDGPGGTIKTSDLRKDVFNGQIVQKYSREFRQIFENTKGRLPSPPVDAVDEVWVGSNGLVLRAESIAYDGNNGRVLQKSILVWEYDPKDIKIEAPIK